MVPAKLRWREKYPYGLSASQFGMALGFCGKVSDFVYYIRHMVGTEQEFAGNAATAHGIRTESMARCCYEAVVGNRVFEGGFFPSADGLLGASPDGISFYSDSAVGNNTPSSNGLLVGGGDGAPAPRCMRLLEIKCPFRALYDGSKAQYQPFGIPLQYMCQMQGQMALSGAMQCDFFVFLKGPPSTQIVLWRVHYSEKFWEWCRPKLLQVVQWLKDGPPEGLDRSFSFDPFDFATIDVRPILFPFDLTLQKAIFDARRFPFFFSRHGGVSSWQRRQTLQPPVHLEENMVLSQALLTCFGGSLCRGSLLFCAQRVLVVASVDWDRSLLVLYYGQVKHISSTFKMKLHEDDGDVKKVEGSEHSAEMSSDANPNHDDADGGADDDAVISTVVVRFFQTEILLQFSLVMEQLPSSGEGLHVDEEGSAKQVLFPVCALVQRVEVGDVVELLFPAAASCSNVDAQQQQQHFYYVAAVWDGLKTTRGGNTSSSSQQSEGSTSQHPYGLLLKIVGMSSGGIVDVKSSSATSRSMIVPHYLVRRKVRIEPSPASLSSTLRPTASCYSSSAAPTCLSPPDQQQQQLHVSSSCSALSPSAAPITMDAVDLADILHAPDCLQVVFINSVSSEPSIWVKKRPADSSTAHHADGNSGDNGLRMKTVLLVSAESLVLMLAEQAGYHSSSPLCIDDDDDDDDNDDEGEVMIVDKSDPQLKSGDGGALAVADETANCSPLLRRQCTEDVRTIAQAPIDLSVANWAKRLVRRDPAVVVVCLTKSVTSDHADWEDQESTALPSFRSYDRIGFLKQALASVLFVNATVSYATAVVDAARSRGLH